MTLSIDLLCCVLKWKQKILKILKVRINFTFLINLFMVFFNKTKNFPLKSLKKKEAKQNKKETKSLKDDISLSILKSK